MTEFRHLFARDPAMLEEAQKNPDLVPVSLRVTLAGDDRREVVALTRRFGPKPGVRKAVSAIHGPDR
jgi:hypothetical protein